MAYNGRLTDEEEASMGIPKPYSQVSSRDPLEDVSSLGIDDLDHGDDLAVSAPPSPRERVMKALSSPKIPAPAPSDIINSPEMRDYAVREQALAGYRKDKVDSDRIANMGAAFAQMAQGANKPQSSDALYSAMNKQGTDQLKETGDDLDRRQKVMSAVEARKSREGIANDNRLARKSQAADRQSRQDDRDDDKHDVAVGKMITAMKDDLDPNKARGGNMASNQKRVDNADRVQTLLDQVHNNPDPRQMEELAISAQALISASGTPAAEQVKALIPHSAWGNTKKFAEWLTNEPLGTDQQAFVQRMADTVKREREVAAGQVEKAQRQRLSAHQRLKDADEDSYNGVLNAYGLGDSKPGMTAKDESTFPKQVKKGGQVATVSNASELAEAQKEGWN